MTRCKFKLNSVTERIEYSGKRVWDAEFSAVYSDKEGSENKAFWDATPSGSFKVATVKQMPWQIGKEYYLDISEAEDPR